VLGVRRRLEPALVPGPDAVLAHEALDPAQADTVISALQLTVHAPRAVGSAAFISAWMLCIKATVCGSLSRVRSGVPPRFQARQPLMLTVSTSHMSGRGHSRRCGLIQAYFTARPSESTPSLF